MASAAVVPHGRRHADIGDDGVRQAPLAVQAIDAVNQPRGTALPGDDVITLAFQQARQAFAQQGRVVGEHQ